MAPSWGSAHSGRAPAEPPLAWATPSRPSWTHLRCASGWARPRERPSCSLTADHVTPSRRHPLGERGGTNADVSRGESARTRADIRCAPALGHVAVTAACHSFVRATEAVARGIARVSTTQRVRRCSSSRAPTATATAVSSIGTQGLPWHQRESAGHLGAPERCFLLRAAVAGPPPAPINLGDASRLMIGPTSGARQALAPPTMDTGKLQVGPHAPS